MRISNWIGSRWGDQVQSQFFCDPTRHSNDLTFSVQFFCKCVIATDFRECFFRFPLVYNVVDFTAIEGGEALHSQRCFHCFYLPRHCFLRSYRVHIEFRYVIFLLQVFWSTCWGMYWCSGVSVVMFSETTILFSRPARRNRRKGFLLSSCCSHQSLSQDISWPKII